MTISRFSNNAIGNSGISAAPPADAGDTGAAAAPQSTDGDGGSTLFRNLAIGAGIAAVGLAAAAVIASRHGHPNALKRLLPMAGVVGGAALLSGCTSAVKPGDYQATKPEDFPSALDLDPSGKAAYEQSRSEYDKRVAEHQQHLADKRAETESVLALGAGVPGITAERAGRQNVLAKLPVSEFTSTWKLGSTTTGHSSSVGGSNSSTDSASADVAWNRDDFTAAVGRANSETEGGVWSETSSASRTDAVTSSDQMVYAFTSKTAGNSLGAPMGTRAYPSIADAIATIETAYRTNALSWLNDAGKGDWPEAPGETDSALAHTITANNTYALVETPEGLRPFVLNHEFTGVNEHAPLLIENPKIKAVVADGSVYTPATSLTNLADPNQSGTLFAYQSTIAAMASTGASQVAWAPVDDGAGPGKTPPAAPAGTPPMAEHGPSVSGPNVGVIEIETTPNSLGRTKTTKRQLEVGFEHGQTKRGYKSLEGARAVLASGHKKDGYPTQDAAGFIYKVDDNYYVLPSSDQNSSSNVRLVDADPHLQEVREYSWDYSHDVLRERVITPGH